MLCLESGGDKDGGAWYVVKIGKYASCMASLMVGLDIVLPSAFTCCSPDQKCVKCAQALPNLEFR